MFKKSKTIFVLCLLFSIQFCIAEELEDIDFELEFANHKKSTIENFPFQEIDQEALSDAAIPGALQVQTQHGSNADMNGKPIYQKQDEENKKKQTEVVLSDSEKEKVSDKELLNFSQILLTQPVIQPIYQQPTGRTYTEHHTTTLSRP